MWITAIFFFNLVTIQFSFAGDLIKGFEEYNKGNYAGALQEWEYLAEQDDAIAPLTGRYLGNQEEIKARIEGVKNQTK